MLRNSKDASQQQKFITLLLVYERINNIIHLKGQNKLKLLLSNVNRLAQGQDIYLRLL